mgnify:CR=1 FL=1
MKKLYLFLFVILVSCSSQKDLSLKTVSVKEFKNFVNATGYVTSAEEYGWSFVQQNVYDYIVVDGANWLKPDGTNALNCYVDADFAGTFSNENTTVSLSDWTVKSGCPEPVIVNVYEPAF